MSIRCDSVEHQRLPAIRKGANQSLTYLSDLHYWAILLVRAFQDFRCLDRGGEDIQKGRAARVEAEQCLPWAQAQNDDVDREELKEFR